MSKLLFDDEFNALNMWNGASGTWQASYTWSPNGYMASDMTSWFVNPSYGPTSAGDANPYSISNGVHSIGVKPTPSDVNAANIGGASYLSGMLTTYGSFSQEYGYFEINAEMSSAPGTMSALWLLPTSGAWPPEIDIAEVLGNSPTMLATTAHTSDQSAQKQQLTTVADMTRGFHTYAVDWEANTVTWYFDNKQVYQIATPSDMHQPMYLLLDTAAGTSSSWEGAPNGGSSAMQVNYIHVYDSNPYTSATPPPPPPPATAPGDTSTGGELTTTSGGTLTDAAGNKWTLTSAGEVDENGTVVPGGTGTSALAIVNNVVYGQDANSQKWYTYTPATQTWTASAAPVLTGSASSPPPTPTPVPTPPSPTPAPSGPPTTLEVTPTSGGTLTDAAGNKWTLTSAGVIDENGTAIPGGSGTSALAVVNNVVYGQDASTQAWYTYSPATQSWASSAAPVLTTTPTPTPTPASANDTVVKLGSTAAIIDASNNKWTITAGGKVAVNGATDTTTANVRELAYVNGKVWQENANGLWWGKTSPGTSWSPNAGTATSPLPTSVTIASNQSTQTVAWDKVSVIATSGNHMVFIGGTGDTVTLSGGTDTITDTGSANTYVIPAAGKGYDHFTTNVLTAGDTFDLRTALAATNWNGAASTLSKYLSLAPQSQAAVLSIAPTSGGVGVAVATIDGAATTTLTGLLSHAIT